MNKIPWHIKFLLLFRKTYVSVDMGSNDHVCILYYKYLGDKIYIVGEEYEAKV